MDVIVSCMGILMRKFCFLPVVIVALVFLAAGCIKTPDPWSPSTYPLELSRYEKDNGSLGSDWVKYKIKKMDDFSFFYGRDDIEAVITVTFTCGKYRHTELSLVADHLIFSMGRNVESKQVEYLDHKRAEICHLLALGEYFYHEKTEYKEIGVIPDLKDKMVMDAYVVREKHCIIDIVYTVPPKNYDVGIDDFHNYLSSLGVPVGTTFDMNQSGG
jgi:hypothetical protein